ncbi:uncharacterized protein LOC111637503 [Centruroides sculpturatus]|uniref:uncharacterized protein LOC111637503 n=1 Tax=Centruroides sculpturatus TaxID=218467 RepID=UPI000C6CEC2E|nr:uncharacterized protein LOC111637503 [Centruroides sculpturatus]
MHLFHFKDSNIVNVALGALGDVETSRIKRSPNIEDICQYLEGSMEGDLGNPSKDITSIWTRLKMATRRLKKKINISWTNGPNNVPTIAVENNCIRVRGCQHTLDKLLKHHHLQRLTAKPDQGKAFKITASNEVSNHFLSNGQYTRFSDWRFIHRARLSVVALRGHKCFGNKAKTCRRCGFICETLSHVLSHCPPNFRLITQRHNAVLNRLVNAFQPRGATVLVNQRVPGLQENCRPDLIILHEETKTATVVDVMTPFENRQPAFDAARKEKERKYHNLIQHLRSQGYDMFFEAFVIKALGRYDPLNESILQRLGIGY